MAAQERIPLRFVVTGVVLAIALLLALIASLDDAAPDVGAGGAAATSRADTWQTYFTDAGDFEVDLPREPRLTSVVGPASAVEGAPGVSLVSVAEMVTYGVLVYELDDPATAARAAAVLNEAVEESIRSRLVPSLEIIESAIGGGFALQYRFSLNPGTTTLIRLGAVGSQVVQLTVSVDRGGEPDEAARFFDSWRTEAAAAESP